MLKTGLMLAVAVATTACTKDQSTFQRNDFCTPIEEIAQTLDAGETIELKYGRHGRWLVDSVKWCVTSETDPRPQRFCQWVMGNTSTEFFENNILNTISCLSGAKFKGPATGVKAWEGKMTFHRTQIPSYDVDIILEYKMAIGGFDGWADDFLKIGITKEQ
ncbi:hypothetical protein GCM10017044_10540 [Kordiimonas sediminis]|uniref:Uncharacterized protein n=1 Tax=Kordiimonas sediminis TaxID=1735581 RepID=A0A919E460_9PROT|nr:hypothetical protein [Kordiimonas sediminis]GHF17939.1 hypothetical protein GCM10017044_10540 [Kordiimonas sediminis]